MDARKLAAEVLTQMEETPQAAGDMVREVLRKYDYEPPREKAFFKRLTEGVVERALTLDYALNQFSSVQTPGMKPLVRAVLRCGAYQSLYMNHVPEAAACNEAVRIVQKKGLGGLSGFVNGVLRALCRGKDAIPWPDPGQDLTKALSVRYSVPEWLVSYWMESYGRERMEALLQGAIAHRPLFLRMREREGRRAILETAGKIAAQGVSLVQSDLLEYAYAAENAGNIACLPGYREGRFFVQDLSGMLVVEAAGLSPGEKVLDLCAAPGGKTLSIAEKLRGRGELIAMDISPARVARMRENIARMDCGWVQCLCMDAREENPRLNGWADVVFADVPCSGLGVIGRKTDIRYRMDRGQIEKLAVLQRQILENACRFVAPGGLLVYSTCTVSPVENEEMASWLEGLGLEPESLDPYWPGKVRNEQTRRGTRLLFAGEDGTDGCFVARMRKPRRA